jgi:hypothetical protein
MFERKFVSCISMCPVSTGRLYGLLYFNKAEKDRLIGIVRRDQGLRTSLSCMDLIEGNCSTLAGVSQPAFNHVT